MALISDEVRQKIKEIFDENLVNPVRMIYFTIPASQLIVPGRESCETCNDVQELVEEVASISDKLSVEVQGTEVTGVTAVVQNVAPYTYFNRRPIELASVLR